MTTPDIGRVMTHGIDIVRIRCMMTPDIAIGRIRMGVHGLQKRMGVHGAQKEFRLWEIPLTKPRLSDLRVWHFPGRKRSRDRHGSGHPSQRSC